jgi:hypothetical protein
LHDALRRVRIAPEIRLGGLLLQPGQSLFLPCDVKDAP